MSINFRRLKSNVVQNFDSDYGIVLITIINICLQISIRLCTIRLSISRSTANQHSNRCSSTVLIDRRSDALHSQHLLISIDSIDYIDVLTSRCFIYKEILSKWISIMSEICIIQLIIVDIRLHRVAIDACVATVRVRRRAVVDSLCAIDVRRRDSIEVQHQPKSRHSLYPAKLVDAKYLNLFKSKLCECQLRVIVC